MSGDAVDLDQVREQAAGCRNCDLWENATQTVFGEGPVPAPVMMVGEQPGDQEDQAGRPFVGPAGRVLDDAMEQAGIVRSDVYVTNAVKHFKWTPRGKRRIHQTPNQIEITACSPWFAAELRAVTPQVLVLLGAVAAKSVFGGGFRVTRDRGRPLDGPEGTIAVATYHPSAVLRTDPREREKRMGELVADLEVVVSLLRDRRSRG